MPAQKSRQPAGTIPVSCNATPDAYGLQVDEIGLGLHAAPSASVLVEPEMPTKAGLAVFYLKGGRGPAIFDLTRNFRPEFARPFAPGSEVTPLIEVIDPTTGEFGRLRADRVGTIHRITGILTPAEVMTEHLRAPKPLPELIECPEGMGEHCVEGAAAYPLVRPGETVVYDPSRQAPAHGALCVLQWSDGQRDVLQTNRRPINRDGEERWFVDPVNRPRNTEMTKRQLDRTEPGRMLYASDGPYTADHLREKIVGTVVGILAPRRHPRGNDEGGSPEASAPTAPATDALTPGSEEAKAAFKDACHQHTIRTQFADEYPVKSQELETDGAVPILAAIEAHAVARTAFCATVNAQDHAMGPAERGRRL